MTYAYEETYILKWYKIIISLLSGTMGEGCYEKSLYRFITSNVENIKYATGNFGVKRIFGYFSLNLLLIPEIS